MNIYSLIPIVCIILSLGYWFYTKNKISQQVQTVNSTDFKAEFANATLYKNQFLIYELPFLKKAMEQSPIDAFNYATTVATPKYLVLSGDKLHLFDTDTDGEIDKHLIFEPTQLKNSRLAVYPLEGQIKAQAQARGKNVKAYKLSLQTDGKAIELILYSCLIFTDIPETPVDAKETVKAIVIANDFLKRLGDCYPNLKVALPIEES